MASPIRLPERYVVTRHIANGGMASVWQAEDQLLGRVVAVKVLGAQFAADESARARFQREARTAAQVSDHPHIVTIYDIGEHEDRAFIVMEHFAGGTVADRLRAARDGGSRVDRETALRWLREAATGLEIAHGAGIVHRDVKPANLLLDTRERLAVGDFGIARLADDTHMTQTGQVLGTAAYLSPEQALGRPATEASDRYALAVVAHELLTGQRPFTAGHPAAQARQHVEADPPRASELVPGLPRAVDAVLARGMAKDPGDRPRTATQLVDDLERAAGGGDGPPTEPTRRIAPRPGRRGAVAAAGAGAAAGGPPGPPAHRRPPEEPEPGGRRRAVLPLALLAAAALLVGVVIAASSGGDDPPAARGGEQARTQAQGGSSRQPAPERTTPAPAPDPPAEEQPPAGGASPADLDAQGFALIGQERYAEAVPILQRAVQGFRDAGNTRSQGYAFALFNLGTALNRSGQPAAAIPLFEERLSFSDDRRGVVQAELDAARAQVDGGGDGNGDGKPGKRNGKKDDDD